MKGSMIVVALVLVAVVAFAEPKKTKGKTPTFSLVAAKNLPGNFLGAGAVCVAKTRIYAVSYQGELFVLDRTKKDYPVVEQLQVTTLPLESVSCNGKEIFITSLDGRLYVLDASTLMPLSANSYSDYGLNSLVVDTGILVSRGQGELTADSTHVFLSELNQGDVGVSIDESTMALVNTYGLTYQPGTGMYDRSSGALLGSIANPPDVNGNVGQVNLNVDSGILIQTTPGCCGTGVFLYDSQSLQFLSHMTMIGADSTLIMNGGILVVGSEAGIVNAYDINDPTSPQQLTGVDMHTLTGQATATFEVRGADSLNSYIFAVSTDSSGLNFFVLQLK